MMKKNLKYLLALLCIIVLLLCTGCSSNNAAPQPISITVWTYYNGTLLESFNTLVKTFNETVGKEKGIIVEAYSQGSVNELEASVMQSAEGKVGAAAMPNIFSAYADTAYARTSWGWSLMSAAIWQRTNAPHMSIAISPKATSGRLGASKSSRLPSLPNCFS